jgi:hypothetical protein
MKTKYFLAVLAVVCLALFFACGGENGETGEEAKQEADVTQEGIDVAEEILATFDKAVAEAVELVKDKPEPAMVKPQLQALYAKYDEKMKALNVKYLALKEKDIRAFGAANGYLGENRGKHVFKKDQELGKYISHYNYEVQDPELGTMLSREIVNMLDVAVQR